MISTRKKLHLPLYSLFIHPRDLKELRSDVWCDEPVDANLKIGKQQYKIGIVYRGSLTRKFPKKSYHIKFYHPRLHLGAHELHLNAEYLDPSMMRNKLALDYFRMIGAVAPEAHYVQIHLNGSSAGIYLQLESVDGYFLRKRELPSGPIYYAVDDDANFSLISPHSDKVKKSLENGYERKYGTKESDAQLRELIYKINTIPRADFARGIVKYIDVEKYLLWLIGVVCTQNFDGFIHNYALYRNSKTRLWEMIPWDYDATFGRDCKMKIMEYDYIPIHGYNTLTARILDVDAFRHRYRNLLEEALDTHFTSTTFSRKISELERLLRPHLLLDPHKKHTIKQFEREPDMMLRFVKDRNRYLRKHLSDLD